MNTILAIFYQLALLYAYCPPVWGDIQDGWLLAEATICFIEAVPRAHYTNKVILILNNNHYYLLADVYNDGNIIDVLQIRLEEFNCFFDDKVFVILNDGSSRVIRLKFPEKSEVQRLGNRVFSTTHLQPQYKLAGEYMILKLGIADRLGNTLSEHFMDQIQPIYFTVFVGLDQNQNETEKRRFIVHGGAENQLFVVFDRYEFNIMRGTRDSDDRFVLAVKSPGDFEDGVMLSAVNDAHEKFGEYIMDYVSSSTIVPVPEALYFFADNL